MFNTNDGNDQITDFNVDEDTLTLVGFGYRVQIKYFLNDKTYDGSVIFNDQGTQIRLAGLTLDDATNVSFVLRSSSDTGDDGALVLEVAAVTLRMTHQKILSCQNLVRSFRS